MGDRPVVGKIEFDYRDPYGLKSRIRRSENLIPKVFVCIRLKPKSSDPKKSQAEFRNNLNRAKIAARYAILNGYDPEATTIYFTQFLNDSSEPERNLVRKIGQARLINCNELWSVRNKHETPSLGMVSDMEFAAANNIPIKYKNFSEIKAWVKNYDKTPH